METLVDRSTYRTKEERDRSSAIDVLRFNPSMIIIFFNFLRVSDLVNLQETMVRRRLDAGLNCYLTKYFL